MAIQLDIMFVNLHPNEFDIQIIKFYIICIVVKNNMSHTVHVGAHENSYDVVDVN